MAKKILFCASTVSHILNFHLPYLQSFHEQGYEVWVAADKQTDVPYADRVVALPFAKNILSFKNIKAVFLARKLLKRENFELLSTHTSLASAVVRAAALLLHKRPKIVCTVHGYLFEEDSGLKKWIYLIPEKLCARVTDLLMVMNREDYEIAVKHRLCSGRIVCIDGMGIRLERFAPAQDGEKEQIRHEYHIPETDFVFVYAAEFSKRKNQAFLIRAFAEICRKYPQMRLILAGKGALQEDCRELARQLGVQDSICFPGHIADIGHLYTACDVCVSSSRIEGLPFNIMEAMACGLPVIASDIKGHRELVAEGETGWLYQSGNSASLQEKLEFACQNRAFGEKLRKKCVSRLEPFELQTVLPKIMKNYEDILK